MSCYIQKSLQSTTEYYPISENGPYNAIYNGLIWNLKFTAITLFFAFLVWSKLNIPLLNRLKKELRRGEDVAMIQGHIADISQERGQLPVIIASWWDAFKKWLFFDQEYLVKAVGETGYEYFTFQRYIIAYQLVLTFVSLVIMLPTHLAVGNRFETSQFAATTVANLGSDRNNLTYIHVTGSFLLLPMTLITMRMFIKRMGKIAVGNDFAMRRTLFLTGLPMRLRNPDAIAKYLHRRYPGCRIESIRVNIEIDSISNLEDELNLLQNIIREAEKSDASYLFPRCRFCACLNRNPAVPPLAVEFYGEKKRHVENEIRRETKEMFSKDRKIDSAFVCMEQLEDARQIGKCNHMLLLLSDCFSFLGSNYFPQLFRVSPQIHPRTQGLRHQLCSRSKRHQMEQDGCSWVSVHQEIFVGHLLCFHTRHSNQQRQSGQVDGRSAEY